MVRGVELLRKEQSTVCLEHTGTVSLAQNARRHLIFVWIFGMFTILKLKMQMCDFQTESGVIYVCAFMHFVRPPTVRLAVNLPRSFLLAIVLP